MANKASTEKELLNLEAILSKEKAEVYRAESREEILFVHLFYILAKQLEYQNETLSEIKDVLVKLSEKDSPQAPSKVKNKETK